MHDEERDDRGHAEEMYDPGELVAAEEPRQLLQLHWLPDVKPDRIVTRIAASTPQ